MGIRIHVWLALVGGGAVGVRNGDIVEAEVDAKLGAMVDDVVKEHGADSVVPRAVVDGFSVEG
jgi:hypothetical protein